MDAPRGPIAEPAAGYRPPEITRADGVTRIHNFTPRERLILYSNPGDETRLLFMRRRAARLLPGGRVLWRDDNGARTLIFEDSRVDTILPLNAARSDPALRPRARSRTVREFTLAPVAPDDPLVWLLSDTGSIAAAVGRADVPEHAMLGQLVNAGWTARNDEAVVFASALTAELRRISANGQLIWHSDWPLTAPPAPPRLTARGGKLGADFTVVQHGITPGPDGNSYVLARDSAAGTDRLLVFDSTGRWIRAAHVPSGHAIFADGDGRVSTLAPVVALARSDAPARLPFEPAFALPTLAGGDTVRLADLRGRIAVLNFWASWCGPCREEMPLLSEFASEMDSTRVVVLGMNEDVAVEDAREFLRELGGVSFASVQGHGKLKERYHYIGLPYTIILDRRGRIIRVIYGFGDDIAPVRETVLAELRQPQTIGPK